MPAQLLPQSRPSRPTWGKPRRYSRKETPMSDAALDLRGHNAPPEEVDNITARLTETQADLLKRRDELLSAADRVPTVIESDGVDGRSEERRGGKEGGSTGRYRWSP